MPPAIRRWQSAQAGTALIGLVARRELQGMAPGVRVSIMAILCALFIGWPAVPVESR